MDILAVVHDLATAFATAGMPVYEVVPDAGDTPCVVINPFEDIEYGSTLSGMSRITFTVTVFTSADSLEAAQRTLYPMFNFRASNTSLIDALEASTATSYKRCHVNSAGTVSRNENLFQATLSLTLDA